MLKPVDLMLCIHPIKLRFQSSKCRGVSHTPWRERKRNDNTQKTTIPERTTLPPWRAYAIRPYIFCKIPLIRRCLNRLIWCCVFTQQTQDVQSNKCRGVSHTPWSERKRNDNTQQTTNVGRASSPLWRAYAIRPYIFCKIPLIRRCLNRLIWCCVFTQ